MIDIEKEVLRIEINFPLGDGPHHVKARVDSIISLCRKVREEAIQETEKKYMEALESPMAQFLFGSLKQGSKGKEKI